MHAVARLVMLIKTSYWNTSDSGHVWSAGPARSRDTMSRSIRGEGTGASCSPSRGSAYSGGGLFPSRTISDRQQALLEHARGLGEWNALDGYVRKCSGLARTCRNGCSQGNNGGNGAAVATPAPNGCLITPPVKAGLFQSGRVPGLGQVPPRLLTETMDTTLQNAAQNAGCPQDTGRSALTRWAPQTHL